MADKATLELRREALAGAIASGVLTVKSGEELTTYRSMKEMREALAFIDGELAKIDGGGRVRRVRVHSSQEY